MEFVIGKEWTTIIRQWCSWVWGNNKQYSCPQVLAGLPGSRAGGQETRRNYRCLHGHTWREAPPQICFMVLSIHWLASKTGFGIWNDHSFLFKTKKSSLLFLFVWSTDFLLGFDDFTWLSVSDNWRIIFLFASLYQALYLLFSKNEINIQISVAFHKTQLEESSK